MDLTAVSRSYKWITQYVSSGDCCSNLAQCLRCALLEQVQATGDYAMPTTHSVATGRMQALYFLLLRYIPEPSFLLAMLVDDVWMQALLSSSPATLLVPVPSIPHLISVNWVPSTLLSPIAVHHRAARVMVLKLSESVSRSCLQQSIMSLHLQFPSLGLQSLLG